MTVDMPLGIVVGLLAVLLAIAFAIGEDRADAPPPEPAAPTAVIARRVEALRDLRFRRMPAPVPVSPATARKEGLADLDRGYPVGERRADEALYAALGLVPAGTDLRDVSATLFGEQVAGYYDPRTGRLRVVEGPAGNRVVDEITLAHELVHAVEDQVFELDVEAAEQTGDAGYAYRALVEGTATALMLEYARRHFGAEEALGGLLASAVSVRGTTPLPPFVQESLVWPYLGGREFVAELYATAGDSWRLVDVALRVRPPSSTEQVLHPEKWLRVEEPEPVRLRGVAAALGPGWSRATHGIFGEWQTGQLLALSGRRRPEAAAGWGGDRYELWQRGGRSVVIMRWRWDDRREAQEFAPALREAVAEGIQRPSALRARGRDVTLVVAPDAATADRVLAAVTA